MSPRLSRRRFLMVSAAALVGQASASPVTWQGHALGAEVSLSIHAPRPEAEGAMAASRTCLAEVEALFSLYDPTSELSRLNRTGILSTPPARFRDLAGICTDMHRATGGVFDPTIQPLWQALARGESVDPRAMTIGWQHVRIGSGIRLASGQAVTLNGIAQGYATDLVRARLRDLGLTRVLVNIGEYAALGGPFDLGIADPGQGIFATRRLRDSAIATSSPDAMRLAESSHILHPRLARGPLWSTVSVEARDAAMADALSTAFTLMTEGEIRACLRYLPSAIRVTLLAQDGRLREIGEGV